MVDRFRSLGRPGKALLVIAGIACLIGCTIGARRLLQQGPAFGAQEVPAEAKGAHHPGNWLTLEVVEAGWNREWFSPQVGPNTFTATTRMTAGHPFIWVMRAELRIKDSAGNTRWSSLQIKKVVCRHDPGHGNRMKECQASQEFSWNWSGRRPDTGEILPDGSYDCTLTVRLLAKTASHSSSVGIDTTGPSVVVEQPSGQITGSSVPVAVTWSDTLSGSDAATGEITLDGTTVTSLTVDSTGARGSIDGVSVGPHSLGASVADLAGNTGTATSDFEVTEEQEPAQKTRVVGVVKDATGQPLAGVSVNSSDAARAATSAADGTFLLELATAGTQWIDFDIDGFVPVQRPAEVREGQDTHIGEIRMVALDSRVTTVSVEGGAASDSTGEIQLVVPAGALSAPVDIRLTQIPSSLELPGPLNASQDLRYPIAFTFCVYIEPYGTTFNEAATIRSRNRSGFPAGFQIPTAMWDSEANRWIPDGGHMTVSADGSMIEKQLGSLTVPGAASPRGTPADARAAASAAAGAPRRGLALDSNMGTAAQGPMFTSSSDSSDPNPCEPAGSSVTVGDSVYQKTISLPSLGSLGVDRALSLKYRSDAAAPSGFVNIVNTLRGSGTGGLLSMGLSVQINGQRKDMSFSTQTMRELTNRLKYFWDGRNGAREVSPTGLYDYTATNTLRYSGFYAIQNTWGGIPTGVSSVPSGESVEKRRVLTGSVALVNAIESPFGAGWSLSGVPRIFAVPDGRVLVVDGGSESGIYHPYINYARINEGASVIAVKNDGYYGQGDKRNMLGYNGASASVEGAAPQGDGFMFNSSDDDWDWVIVDLGRQRQIHTLGLSFSVVQTPEALITEPVLQIYTSLDNSTWTLWSEAQEDMVDGFAAVKLSSPYLAGHGTTQPVRYVKYHLMPPYTRGVTAQNVIYRVFAFGASDRYGNGPNGEEEDWPRLRRVQEGGWEQSERDGTRYLYDGRGLLQSVTDIHGNATTYSWSSGRLNTVTDPTGGITQLSYSGGRLTEITDAAGRRTLFDIDGNGDLASVTMPDGSQTRFTFDSRHLITAQTDPRGKVTTYTWDATYPNLKTVRKPDGAEMTLDAGYFRQMVNTMQDWDPIPGATITSKVTEPAGETKKFLWGEGGTTIHDTQVYTADSRYKLYYEQQAYHPRRPGQVIKTYRGVGSSSPSQTTSYYFDEEDRTLVKRIENLGVGNTDYTYERTFGKVATVKDAGGHISTYQYNDKGDLVSSTDALGNTTLSAYDERGLLASVTGPDGAVTQFEYDAKGNRVRTTDPLGRVTQTTYDGLGNVTSMTDPMGRLTRWEYDVLGRVQKAIDPAGGQTLYEYEPAGCSSGCGGGAASLLRSITDPLGQATRFEYDDAGRMTAVINALGIRKEYGYDQAGRVIRFRNGRAQEITYEYLYPRGVPTMKKTLPDEGIVTYTYLIPWQQLTSAVDSDSTLRYEYTRGTVTSALGYPKTLEYFGINGDARYLKQGSGSISYQYTSELLLTQEAMRVDLPAGGPRLTQTMVATPTHDQDHRLTNLQYSTSTIEAPQMSFGYDATGRRTSMTVRSRGNGPVMDQVSYQFDTGGQLLELAHRDSGGSLQARYAYSYDLAGNRVTMDDDQGRHAFGYDDRYQLTTATHPLDPAESFTYDAAGNRLTSHLSATYRYNAANQLIEDAEFTYSFDADGNCTGKISKVNGERHEYIFNSENRMIGYRKYDISGTVLVSADYFYDAIGRRMAKSVDGLLTRYLYQDEDIWMELAPDGQIQRTYGQGPGMDEPLATWGADNRIYFYVTDALGTVRHIHDDNPSAFNLVATFDYDSFGQLLPSSSAGWNDAYRYTSRESDPESGTYFYRARHYDPHSGRFTAEDQFPQRHLYAYVGNNPVNAVDPLGLYESRGVAGVECAMKIVSKMMRKKCCRINDDAWLSPGGPPYIMPAPTGSPSRPFLPPGNCGYAQRAEPFLYLWVNTVDPKCTSCCGLASTIVHEMLHLNRRDNTDYEDEDDFTACSEGCVQPGQFK